MNLKNCKKKNCKLTILKASYLASLNSINGLLQLFHKLLHKEMKKMLNKKNNKKKTVKRKWRLDGKIKIKKTKMEKKIKKIPIFSKYKLIGLILHIKKKNKNKLLI